MRKGVWAVVAVGLLIALFAAGVVSYYASSAPDGLEKVAGDQGFLENASESANSQLPTAGYAIAGVDDERLSVGLAGVLGVAVMAVLGFGLFWLLARGKKASAGAAAPPSEPKVDA